MSCIPLRASNAKAKKADLQESLDKANKVRQSIIKRKTESNNRSANLAQRISPNVNSDIVTLSNTTVPFPISTSEQFMLLIDESANSITYSIEEVGSPFSSEDKLSIISIFDSPTVYGIDSIATENGIKTRFWQETDTFTFNNKQYNFGCLVTISNLLNQEDRAKNYLNTTQINSSKYVYEVDDSTPKLFNSLANKVDNEGGGKLGALILYKALPAVTKEKEWFSFSGEELVNGSKLSIEFFTAEIIDGVTNNLTSIGYPSKTQGFTYSHVNGGAGTVQMPEPIETKPVSSGSYDIDEARPYGPIFKTMLPGGYPVDGPKCSTKQSGSKILKAAVERIINELVQTNYPQIQNITNYKEEILSTYEHVCNIESAGILYAPQSRFEIRPEVGKGVSGIRNLLDTGPRPRSIKIKKSIRTINSTHRPVGAKYFSACGLFQYTIDTWRSEFNKWKGHWGATENYIHVWDAPPEWQVLIQGSNFIESIYAKTTPDKIGGLQYPAIWRAIALYLKNVHNSPGTSFINTTIEKINEAIASSNEELTSDELHIICRNVWESRALRAGNWYYTSNKLKQKHLEQSYRIAYKMALAPGALPSKYPNIYESSSNLLPDKRK
tara:strand:+ start:3479 stop:5308 length:1830 start_codon:yes stop_codon:yes gene_type:complete